MIKISKLMLVGIVVFSLFVGSIGAWFANPSNMSYSEAMVTLQEFGNVSMQEGTLFYNPKSIYITELEIQCLSTLTPLATSVYIHPAGLANAE